MTSPGGASVVLSEARSMAARRQRRRASRASVGSSDGCVVASSCIAVHLFAKILHQVWQKIWPGPHQSAREGIVDADRALCVGDYQPPTDCLIDVNRC